MISALQRLKQPRSDWFRRSQPIVAILSFGLGLIGFRFNDPMYGSAMLAVLVGVLVFNLIQRTFCQGLEAIWNRKIVHRSAKATELSDDDPARSDPAGDLKTAFVAFVHGVEARYGKAYQWLTAAGVSLVVVFWRFYYWREKQRLLLVEPFSEITTTLFGHRLDYAGALFGLAGELACAVFIGICIWRLIVIAQHLWRLGRQFKLVPHLLHPDGCGGLKPIGDLCLLNAFIVSIPGIYLFAWLTLDRVPFIQQRYADLYQSLHEPMLAIPIFLAVLLFFMPVWYIHKALVAERNAVQRQIDNISYKINEIVESLLPQQDKLTSDVAEETASQLKSFQELNQQLYQVNKQFPVWPFNTRIVFHFGLSQAPQLMGLLGLAEPVIQMLNGALQSISHLIST
ncbi:MAG: hypothetical protein QNJ22_02600 [Desulfosarcinaceae bacterium]|nr:hypothetical protein [Desulfosarcinaceae bacterium]